MTDATAFPVFTSSDDLSSDEAPDTVDASTGDFNPEFPGSTPDAPYGFFPDGRARKRRPKGHGGTRSTVGRMPANDRQAETAAALLARLNVFVGIALTTAGMPKAAAELASNNVTFESMAREALLSDPALCKKILSAGATSGKAGLVMAYVMLGATTFPAMKEEYRENHPKEILNDPEWETA